MDLKKLLKKVPALLAKVKDAKNIDGKVTLADLTFALELVQVAFEQGVIQVARGQNTGRGASGDVLKHDDFDQMEAYLASVSQDSFGADEGATTPTTGTQTDAGVVINPTEDTQDENQVRGGVIEWIPVGRFVLFTVLPKLVKKFKAK